MAQTINVDTVQVPVQQSLRPIIIAVNLLVLPMNLTSFLIVALSLLAEHLPVLPIGTALFFLLP